MPSRGSCTREEPDLELIAAPGNPGIAELGECVPINVLDIDALERLARERAVDLTVVGPEAPLEAGIVDRFRAAGLPIFGPTRAAAEIETSKAFAKQLLLDEGIPTARAEIHTRVAGAKAAARRFGAPVVVKASGLAAGKGVIVCKTLGDADSAIDDMLEGNRFGAAGASVLIEEFMQGEEVSLFAITDGTPLRRPPGTAGSQAPARQRHGPQHRRHGRVPPRAARLRRLTRRSAPILTRGQARARGGARRLRPDAARPRRRAGGPSPGCSTLA